MGRASTMGGMILATLASWAALPAGAAVTLYKSIGPDGTILFSDVPPADGSRILERRDLPGEERSLTPMEEAFILMERDADLARANTQLDLAEHALALARRSNWSPRDGLRLDAMRMTPADHARVTFYQRNVQAARKAFLDKLRERRLAARSP